MKPEEQGKETASAAVTRRRVLAEALGTAGLLTTVVGSGIMAERLAGGHAAVALLCNALATGAGLLALILTFGPISGAHFNPVVTLTAARSGALAWGSVPGYLLAQFGGGLIGVAVADLMFDLPPWMPSQHVRSGAGQWLGEFVATCGLLTVINVCGRARPAAVPYAVAATIVAAYWCTSSTSFANPAVTFARAWTDTYTGIRPVDVPGFLVAQFAGAWVAMKVADWMAEAACRSDG